MFDEISSILNTNEYYIIKNLEDLYNENKINFYYILLKYILKNSIYIYKIPILLQIKNLILNFIIYNPQISWDYKKDKSIKEKFIYIINKFTGSNYYISKYIKLLSLDISESDLSKRQSYLPKTDSFFLKDSLLLYSFKFLRIYIEECFVNFNYFIYFNKKDESTENIENITENDNQRYYYIKNEIKKLKKEKLEDDEIKLYNNFVALTNFIDKIEKYIKHNSAKIDDFELKLTFNEDKENETNNLKNVNCKYEIKSLYFKINDEKKIYQDENILNKEDNINNFKELFNMLNPFTSLSENKKKRNRLNISCIPLKDYNIFSFSSQTELKFIANDEEILKFKEIIDRHDISANYIKELSNGLLISGGPNNLIVYNGIINNKEFEIKISNNNICEIEENKKQMINVLICSENEIKVLKIRNNSNYEYSIRYVKTDIRFKICFQFEKDYIICNQKGIFEINDLLSSAKVITSSKNNVLNKAYFTGIRINREIIALTSNKNEENGEDKIIFYNYFEKRIVKSLEGYSFALSQSNLVLMPREETNEKDKILLCACKKYKEGQENGILYLNCDLKDNFKILSNSFFETKNFEVSCLCPILIIKNSLNIFCNEKEIVVDTEYFLVGGFNSDKKQGLINLFKVNFNKENFEKTKIEYIKNIEIGPFSGKNKFDGFKRNITCILQSQLTGDILITCSDGKVYYFSSPNLNNYILN